MTLALFILKDLKEPTVFLQPCGGLQFRSYYSDWVSSPPLQSKESHQGGLSLTRYYTGAQ